MATRGKSKKPPNRPKPKMPPARPANAEKPLGWLPVPPELEKWVRADMPAIASEKAIRRQLNHDVLSYYYGGDIVLVRDDFEDERGVEVIAAGDDVGPVLRSLTFAQRQRYCVAWPYPWGVLEL